MKFYPSHSRYGNNNNYLFFRIQPKKLRYETKVKEGFNVGTLHSTEIIGDPIFFLAPMEFQATASHEWQPLTNVINRMKEIMATSAQEWEMGSTRHKVDTSLIYQDSNRREIEIMVNLAVHSDAKSDVVDPVDEMRRYAAPERVGTGHIHTEVKNPHVFQVDTALGNGTILPIINIKTAVLHGVLPNFKGPYINGYPSHCELSLSFRDMEPLSEQSYNRVSVG